MSIEKIIKYATINSYHGEEEWDLYDSIEDAVEANGPMVKVYKFVPEYIGTYKRQISLIKTDKTSSKNRKLVRRPYSDVLEEI